MTNVNELKAAVMRRGMTLTGLADTVGMNPATLGRKMRGESEFTQGEMESIKQALDLTREQILVIFFNSVNA